ncbi:tetratricopeptide repeat protein [Planktothrix agardhii]|uniref:tetratricopeptide repeat protein n=1 Tax=Planktothrix agardhii TaxID=1160 RepID=UPI002E300603|nr:tetratricopeptide repeat protein [Planktothrix agardhii]
MQSGEQALTIYRQIGYRQGEACSLGNLGLAYNSLGQYQKAIAFHKQDLEISQEIGYRQGEACSPGNLGLVYNSLGQYQKAIASSTCYPPMPITRSSLSPTTTYF